LRPRRQSASGHPLPSDAAGFVLRSRARCRPPGGIGPYRQPSGSIRRTAMERGPATAELSGIRGIRAFVVPLFAEMRGGAAAPLVRGDEEG